MAVDSYRILKRENQSSQYFAKHQCNQGGSFREPQKLYEHNGWCQGPGLRVPVRLNSQHTNEESS